MKTFKYNGTIEELLTDVQGEIIEVIEGCLIDNYLISTGGCMFCVIESYVNCWTSNYTVFSSNIDKDIEDYWENFKTNFQEA